MNETAVFEGRRTAVSFKLRLAGIFMLGFGVACLGIGVYAGHESGEYVCLAPGALLGLLGATCLIKAQNRPNTRMVIVEPMGVRFMAEGRPQWGIPWTALMALGTKRKADRLDIYFGLLPLLLTDRDSGYKGIFFASDNGMQRLRLGDDFGPENTMKELFRFLAGQAILRRIPVEDGLGWGLGSEALPRRGLNDRLLSTGVLTPPADLDPAGYHDRSYGSKKRHLTGPAVALTLGILVFGLVVCLVGFSGGVFGLGLFGLILALFGLFLVMAVVLEEIRDIKVVAYNTYGVSIRAGLGRGASLRWAQVQRCKLDVDTRQLTIYSDLGKRTGVLDENVMLALCKTYTRATGRPAETWSSGAEAYIGVPARNFN